MFLSFSSSYFVITALIIALNHNSVDSYVVDDSKDLVITYDEKVALDKVTKKSKTFSRDPSIIFSEIT